MSTSDYSARKTKGIVIGPVAKNANGDTVPAFVGSKGNGPVLTYSPQSIIPEKNESQIQLRQQQSLPKLICHKLAFPLLYDAFDRKFKIKVQVAKQDLFLTCSTVRRQLTLSIKDAEHYDLSVPKEDYMYFIQSKKSQYYSTRVQFYDGENKVPVEYSRFRICVNANDFDSRLGLITGHSNKDGIFSQLKLTNDLFAICLHDRSFLNNNNDKANTLYWLRFGKAVTIPKNAIQLTLLQDNISMGKKGLLLFNMHSIQIDNDVHSQIFNVQTIVSLEFSGLGLPRTIYDWLVSQIVKKIDFDQDIVEYYPMIRFLFSGKDNKLVSLLLDPQTYVRTQSSESGIFDFYPIEQDHLIVLGNCMFRDKNVAFSRSSHQAWIW